MSLNQLIEDMHWTVSNVDTLSEPGVICRYPFQGCSYTVLLWTRIVERQLHLAETADGGSNLDAYFIILERVTTTDFDYVPGTTNMYVSTGVNQQMIRRGKGLRIAWMVVIPGQPGMKCLVFN